MKEKKEKKQKVKPPYSLLSNVLFMSKMAWKNERSILFASVADIPLTLCSSLAFSYLGKIAVDYIIDGASPEKYILHIGGLLLFTTIIAILRDTARTIRGKHDIRNSIKYVNIWMSKMIDADYEHLESPEVQNLAMRVKGYFNGFANMFTSVFGGFSGCVTLATYSALILTLNPILFVLIVGLTIADFFVGKLTNKWVVNNYKIISTINRKKEYVKGISSNFNSAKDIRLYGIKDWFMGLLENLIDQHCYWHGKEKQVDGGISVLSALMTLIRDLSGYVFLIFAISNGAITPGDFVFYTGIISNLYDALTDISRNLKELHKRHLEIGELRSFLDLPDRFADDGGLTGPKEAPEIVFDNVTFRYPEAEEDTIKNVSFRIGKGEKIALVGRNGAGKTTLVKLICGFYHPTSGNIYVNGKQITDYSKKEYFSSIAAVFQEIRNLPVSIAQNIAMCEEEKMDRQRVMECLELADLKEKVESLPDKEKTILCKGIIEGAIDLSGGENQKLALARALYKEGKIVVLDEPTAALDPIAEHSLYVKYSRLVSDATSVYISHRLASTRFCDRIILIDEGVIKENGTHEELMKNKGLYAEMFDMQSYYYKEDVK